MRHEPNSGRFSWNSPHTFMYMLQMLSTRMVSLKGYPYFAFGHYRRPVGGLQIRVEGSSRYTQYCLRMLHTPEIPADALSRKVLWTKIRHLVLSMLTRRLLMWVGARFLVGR